MRGRAARVRSPVASVAVGDGRSLAEAASDCGRRRRRPVEQAGPIVAADPDAIDAQERERAVLHAGRDLVRQIGEPVPHARPRLRTSRSRPGTAARRHASYASQHSAPARRPLSQRVRAGRPRSRRPARERRRAGRQQISTHTRPAQPIVISLHDGRRRHRRAPSCPARRHTDPACRHRRRASRFAAIVRGRALARFDGARPQDDAGLRRQIVQSRVAVPPARGREHRREDRRS